MVVFLLVVFLVGVLVGWFFLLVGFLLVGCFFSGRCGGWLVFSVGWFVKSEAAAL